jgi:hypothetical protein
MDGGVQAPPAMGSNGDPEENIEKGCAFYFSLFDETILRPVLIYKYHRYKFKKDIDFEAVLRETQK